MYLIGNFHTCSIDTNHSIFVDNGKFDTHTVLYYVHVHCTLIIIYTLVLVVCHHLLKSYHLKICVIIKKRMVMSVAYQ